MPSEKTLLLIDAGEESLEVLAARVFRLGQRFEPRPPRRRLSSSRTVAT